MIRIGKPDPFQIIPATWSGILAVPVVAGSALVMTQSVIGTVLTLGAFWCANQYFTRHERDGYIMASPLNDMIEPEKTPTSEMTETLGNYGINNSRVAGTEQGPVLTRHLIRLPAGTKLGKLPTDDMARDLGVNSVQIASNAGRGVIGIDIPRNDRQFPKLTELLESEAWQNRSKKMQLPCCPAVDQFGQPFIFDLADAPHLISAGTTGSGKSVFTNAILLSLIASGTDLRLMIADGKYEDFAPHYKHSKHLLRPEDMPKGAELPPRAIATEIPDMRAQVEWLAAEMDRRLRDNDKPYPLLFVMDEMADVVMQDDKDKTISKMFARIAQKGRSAKIHLILITQYPTSEVVNNIIAANTPSRVGLLVDKDHQSRVIIGDGGCEQLQGKGDCLLKLAGKGITRVHGANITNADFKAYLK